jgi:hypothetical protein
LFENLALPGELVINVVGMFMIAELLLSQQTGQAMFIWRSESEIEGDD